MEKLFKRICLLVIFVCFMFSGCSGDDERLNNPNLVDLNFSFQIDLSLPQYNSLNFPGNSFATYNYGINGVVIYTVNNSQYTAFELSDPNHPLKDCSSLSVQGIEATCSCGDGNVYMVITGQQISGEGQYSLKPYRVERFGNILEISN